MGAGRAIWYLFSCIVAIIVLCFLLKWLGVSWADVHNFIRYGIGGALKVLVELRNSIVGVS